MKKNLETGSYVEHTQPINEINPNIAQEYEISDHTSLRINSFGKCALDSSVYYTNYLFDNDEGLIRKRKYLDKNSQYYTENTEQQSYDRAENKVRSDITVKNDPEAYRNILESWKKRSLANGEQAMISKRKINLFNEVFNNWQESPFINAQLGKKELDKDNRIDYIERILEKDQDGDYRIDTEQFRNFLQWHNYEHVKAENEFFKILPKYNKKFIKNIEKGVLKGILPANMLSNTCELDRRVFTIDDGFECIESNIGGNHQFDKDDNEHRILLSPIEDVKFQYFAHESLHAMAGVYYDDEIRQWSSLYNGWVYNNIDLYATAESENCNNIEYYLKATRVMLEATCEFLTAKIAKISEKDLAYKAQRAFIKKISKLSNGRIDITEIESMFFENDYNKFDIYMNKIKKSFNGVDDLLLEIGQIKEWKDDIANTEAFADNILREIFLGGNFKKSGYDADNIDTRFLNNYAYLDYLAEISEKQTIL